MSDPQFSDLVLIAAGLGIAIEDLVREEGPRPGAGDADRPGW